MVFPLLMIGAGIVGGLALLGKGAGVKQATDQTQAFDSTVESRQLGEQDIETYAKSHTDMVVKDSPYATASNQTTNITITKSIQEQIPQTTNVPTMTQTSRPYSQTMPQPIDNLIPYLIVGVGGYLLLK